MHLCTCLLRECFLRSCVECVIFPQASDHQPFHVRTNVVLVEVGTLSNRKIVPKEMEHPNIELSSSVTSLQDTNLVACDPEPRLNNGYY